MDRRAEIVEALKNRTDIHEFDWAAVEAELDRYLVDEAPENDPLPWLGCERPAMAACSILQRLRPPRVLEPWELDDGVLP